MSTQGGHEKRTGKALMGYLCDGAYQECEARYDAEDLAEAFVEVYGGPKGREYFEELQHTEIELDDIWPGWRVKTPFHRLPPDVIADIKRPLKRRRQLLIGAGEWGLRIVWRDAYTPIAVDIEPVRAHIDPPPASYYEPNYSLPHLAASCKLPLATIEAAMAKFQRGGGINARNWCLKWAEEHKPESVVEVAAEPEPEGANE